MAAGRQGGHNARWLAGAFRPGVEPADSQPATGNPGLRRAKAHVGGRCPVHVARGLSRQCAIRARRVGTFDAHSQAGPRRRRPPRVINEYLMLRLAARPTRCQLARIGRICGVIATASKSFNHPGVYAPFGRPIDEAAQRGVYANRTDTRRFIRARKAPLVAASGMKSAVPSLARARSKTTTARSLLTCRDM